ncbi:MULTISPECIES: hypothetical protein [Nitrosomonas]|uniref:hypothetical protein n=1 Tax=Nitrosomonas TaxID=914 RepID=UPI000AD3B962|nr:MULTISPECIES: hypothetical protein [Nitrosomonas]UVS61215.1 hypothetical protein NX761_17325 [Nitrosomonas sp. PLL12]
MKVRFYSRSPFGELAKLREYAATQADEAHYLANLNKGHRETNAELAVKLSLHAPNLSTYEFLNRTTFETSPELGRMESLLYERLRFIASNPRAAYDTLWKNIDQLGARLDSSNLTCSSKIGHLS